MTRRTLIEPERVFRNMNVDAPALTESKDFLRFVDSPSSGCAWVSDGGASYSAEKPRFGTLFACKNAVWTDGVCESAMKRGETITLLEGRTAEDLGKTAFLAMLLRTRRGFSVRFWRREL